MKNPCEHAYTPIESNSIRLLRISKGKDASILGYLKEFALEPLKCPTYMAASYTWGRIDYSKTITLNNGRTLPVLRTLYPFLKMICDHDCFSQDQWWWIDSICINQHDARERASQLQLMGRIYGRAKKTIVWLGEESLDSADAIEFLHLLSRGVVYGTRISDLRDVNLKWKWQALENLLLRPWWRRVWTLQEFVVSPHASFYCGVRNFGKSHLQRAMYMAWRCTDWDNILLRTKAFYPAWNRRRLDMWYFEDRNMDDEGFTDMSLVALMAYVSDHEVTDPRDRIYSLLGLATDHKLVDGPDYQCGVDKVYSKLVKSFVETHESLDIICFGHIFKNPAGESTADPTVPSWVPDWRVHVKPFVIPLMASQSARNHIGNFRPLHSLSFNAAYAATGSLKPQVIFSQDLQQMTCEGILLDNIDGLGGLKETCRKYNETEERSERQYPCVLSTSPTNRSPEIESRASVFNAVELDVNSRLMGIISRCLVLDREDRYLRNAAPQIRFYRDFQAFCRSALENPGHVHPLFLDWFQRNKSLSIRGHNLETLSKNAGTPLPSGITDIIGMCNRERQLESFLGRFRDTTVKMARRLMVTNEGHIGMAPCRARKGDVVCVLLGCSIPLVLRERECKGYEFIGECYLHNFMNGEAVDDVKSGRRMIKSFPLL